MSRNLQGVTPVDDEMDITHPEKKAEKLEKLKLIVCLGNPGEEYAETRHNAGFKVGTEILGRHVSRLSDWQPGNGELFEVKILNQTILLLKPMTYMNASGDAVMRVTQHFGFSPSEVLVVSDCMDMPFGRLRMRLQGSSGGQRGVRSILVVLGTEAVPRLRVGIGRPQSSESDVIGHVLAPWTSVEQELLPVVLAKASEMVVKAAIDGVEQAMCECNSWSADNNNAEKQGVQR